MINDNMPVASPWTTMPEVQSPSLLDHNKNFFDYADEADGAISFYDPVDTKADPAQVTTDLIVEDFIASEDMEATYFTVDSKVILSVVGVEGEEEGMEMEVPASALIPTTALELVMGGDVEFSVPEANATFLNANLPALLGSVSPSCPPPAIPGPISPATPSYPHPPSTSSCHSSCSDDVASTISDVSTPGLSGVTSGEQFVIQLPADDKMAAATLTALETCSLTPLIKEELKYTIQSRRLAAGKPELVVDTTPPVRVKKVMTHEERERALKRRDQNKMAAQRFRQKQKDTADVLLRKCQKLEGANTTLRAEIRHLARESQELRQLLTSHLLLCPKVKFAS